MPHKPDIYEKPQTAKRKARYPRTHSLRRIIHRFKEGCEHMLSYDQHFGAFLRYRKWDQAYHRNTKALFEMLKEDHERGPEVCIGCKRPAPPGLSWCETPDCLTDLRDMDNRLPDEEYEWATTA